MSLSGERIQSIRSMRVTTGSWILSVLKRRGLLGRAALKSEPLPRTDPLVRSQGRRSRGRGGWTSRRLPQRCEAGRPEALLEVVATTTPTPTAAAVLPAAAAVAVSEKEEAAAAAEGGSTPDGEAGAAKASDVTPQSAQCEQYLFFNV